MQGIDFVGIFIQFTLLVVSLSVHESAHAWSAEKIGDPTARRLGRVSLNPAVHVDPIGTILFPLIAIMTNVPVIGWAKPVPVNGRNLRDERRDFVLVAAAGPASNLALAAIAAFVWRMLPGGADELIATIVQRALLMNVLLAVFNMIPVPPLDGGNVLAGLLPIPLARQYDRLRPWGFLLLYGLMLTGTLGAIVVPPARLIISWLL